MFVSTAIECFTFINAENKMQKWIEALFDREKQSLVYARYQRNFNEKLGRRCLYHVNKDKFAVHFWRRVYGASYMFSNGNRHAEEPHGHSNQTDASMIICILKP